MSRGRLFSGSGAPSPVWVTLPSPDIHLRGSAPARAALKPRPGRNPSRRRITTNRNPTTEPLPIPPRGSMVTRAPATGRSTPGTGGRGPRTRAGAGGPSGTATPSTAAPPRRSTVPPPFPTASARTSASFRSNFASSEPPVTRSDAKTPAAYAKSSSAAVIGRPPSGSVSRSRWRQRQSAWDRTRSIAPASPPPPTRRHAPSRRRGRERGRRCRPLRGTNFFVSGRPQQPRRRFLDRPYRPIRDDRDPAGRRRADPGTGGFEVPRYRDIGGSDRPEVKAGRWRSDGPLSRRPSGRETSCRGPSPSRTANSCPQRPPPG